LFQRLAFSYQTLPDRPVAWRRERVNHMNGSRVRVGLLGCGTVGSALIQLVQEQAEGIESRTGLRLEISRVAVRNASKDRGVDLAPERFTNDTASVVNDPDVDVVIEVIGGIEPARQFILDALKAGKPVVTANKELLANHGGEVFATAEASGVDVLFEAAVGGGIPLVRPLRESLLGEPIDRVMGIVNGTTNFILTRMAVEGFDAGAKIAILASIAFGARVVAGDVYHEGISGITAADIAFAGQNGFVVKLVAIAEQRTGVAGPELAVRVHPVMLPTTHPLASVRGSFNAVFVQGAAVGELMFYGRGAGGNPTASAVLGDLIDASLNLRKGSSASIGALGEVPVRPIDDLESAYYLHLHVVDRPGVLATVAGVFGAHDVSISSMSQGLPYLVDQSSEADLVFITHDAFERDVQATLRDLRDLEVVRHVGSVIRVLADETDPA
jgi:homoserine dehydrogenase